MSEVLILEFAGVGADDYFAVNKALGIDDAGEGPWPAPLESHVSAAGDDKLVVIEIWESQAAQAEFMAQLGPALGSTGMPEPSRMEWLSLVHHHKT
jgi:hypothetical protein